MNNLIIDEEFEKLPEHVRNRMIREADSVTYATAFFPDDKLGEELFKQGELARNNSKLAKYFESSSFKPKRYSKIAVYSGGDLRHVQELLYHRMHTARQILEHSISEETRELFVKYLEMIESEIKKALILE